MSTITRNHVIASVISALACIVYAIATTHQGAGTDGEYTFWIATVVLALSAIVNFVIAALRQRAKI